MSSVSLPRHTGPDFLEIFMVTSGISCSGGPLLLGVALASLTEPLLLLLLLLLLLPAFKGPVQAPT
jgi:hypothetical protein